MLDDAMKAIAMLEARLKAGALSAATISRVQDLASGVLLSILR